MEYRNNLDAARMRIETLEAKLAEREASLKAREAELAEQNAEITRLRQTGGKPAESRGVWIALFTFTHFAVAGLGGLIFLGAFGRSSPSYINCPECPPAPPSLALVDDPAAHPPTPSVEGKATDSDTEESAVTQSNDRMRPEVRACQLEQLKKHPDAYGFLAVVFEVEPEGKVGRVSFQGMSPGSARWWSADFETCVTKAYRSLAFRPFEGTKTTAKHTYFLSTNTNLGF
ncbi:hypothetical protein [Polyangium jinanense]|uniref:Uncharacterized protein n=1 Tax=Polyangium jinanense TaxID=2829994 RepID=A0A9X3XI22_9BACT|nr:hypothetical protein [Polyangium jinanense]MDC3962492.1 hypothetical protein [Polyangium jinanense]MDC3988441.1 hypothetical protein [Polyangium jinanense]